VESAATIDQDLTLHERSDAGGFHLSRIPSGALVTVTIWRDDREGLEAATETPAPRQWERTSVIAELASGAGDDAASVADRLLSWAVDRRLRLWFGHGRFTGSAYVMFDDADGNPLYTFSIWTSGGLAVEFGRMKESSTFGSRQLRFEVIRRLNEIPGVAISAAKVDKYPGVLLKRLVPSDAFDAFVSTFDWLVDLYRQGSAAQFDE
jgi:hypothetical protein